MAFSTVLTCKRQKVTGNTQFKCVLAYASDADFERTFDPGIINLFSSLTPEQLDHLLST